MTFSSLSSADAMATDPVAALRVSERLSLSCPITTLSAVPGTSYVLAGTARRLVLVNVESGPTLAPADRDAADSVREWTVFERERIHRIVWRSADDATRQREALVLGGKEAALVEWQLTDDDGHDSR